MFSLNIINIKLVNWVLRYFYFHSRSLTLYFVQVNSEAIL